MFHEDRTLLSGKEWYGYGLEQKADIFNFDSRIIKT